MLMAAEEGVVGEGGPWETAGPNPGPEEPLPLPPSLPHTHTLVLFEHKQTATPVPLQTCFCPTILRPAAAQQQLAADWPTAAVPQPRLRL